MIEKYKVRLGTPSIELVLAERETPNEVIVDGSRHKKYTGFINYFSSFEEARSSLLLHAQNRVNSSEDERRHAKSYFAECQSLRPVS